MDKDHIKNPRNCRDCAFALYGDYCGYYLATGIRRPCEPGDGCKVKVIDHNRRKAWMKRERRTPQPIREPSSHQKLLKKMHEYWGQTHCNAEDLLVMFPEYPSGKHALYKNIRNWREAEDEAEKNGGGTG